MIFWQNSRANWYSTEVNFVDNKNPVDSGLSADTLSGLSVSSLSYVTYIYILLNLQREFLMNSV